MEDKCVCPTPSTCEYCSRMYPCRCEGCPHRKRITIPQLSDEERTLLKQLSKDINRTAYHCGIGGRAGKCLGLLDKLINEPGWELRFLSAAELARE